MQAPTRTIFNEGDGHAVLMLHGLSSSPLELRYLARFLNDERFMTLPRFHVQQEV